MIDERALEAAFRVFTTRNEARDRLQSAKWPINVRDGLSAAIEAYEAARWRPIEEAPRDGETGPWVLVHWFAAEPLGHVGTFSLMFWATSVKAWCVAGGTETFPHHYLLKRRAMFRTIDPPPQNAVSSALRGSSAAEDPSSARVTSSDRASSPDGLRSNK